MIEPLNRPLNKYDLVLCLTYHSNLKDSEYGLYIDDKHVFTDKGLVSLKSVYKISNLDIEQERIKQILYDKCVNCSNKKINVNDLQVGHYYCTLTNRKVYLYLGYWRLEVNSPFRTVGKYNEKHHLFVCFDMMGTTKTFVENSLKLGYSSMDIINNFIYIINIDEDETLNLIICDKPKFIRDIGSININDLTENYKIEKNYYIHYRNAQSVEYIFHK